MKWIAFSLGMLAVGGGVYVAGSATSPPQQERENPASEPEDEDFVPTEKVPADSAISFPVDI